MHPLAAIFDASNCFINVALICNDYVAAKIKWIRRKSRAKYMERKLLLIRRISNCSRVHPASMPVAKANVKTQTNEEKCVEVFIRERVIKCAILSWVDILFWLTALMKTSASVAQHLSYEWHSVNISETDKHSNIQNEAYQLFGCAVSFWRNETNH